MTTSRCHREHIRYDCIRCLGACFHHADARCDCRHRSQRSSPPALRRRSSTLSYLLRLLFKAPDNRSRGTPPRPPASAPVATMMSSRPRSISPINGREGASKRLRSDASTTGSTSSSGRRTLESPVPANFTYKVNAMSHVNEEASLNFRVSLLVDAHDLPRTGPGQHAPH